MKNKLPYLTFQEWQSTYSTYAVNPGAYGLIRGMYEDYKRKRIVEKIEQPQQKEKLDSYGQQLLRELLKIENTNTL